MNRQLVLIKLLFGDQSTDVISRVLQVFRPVSIINLVREEIRMQLSLDGLLRGKNNFFSMLLVFFLILCIFLLLLQARTVLFCGVGVAR